MRRNYYEVVDYAAKAGIEPCIRDKDGRIVAYCVGCSEEELKNLLKKHPGWHYSGVRF